VLVAHVYNSSYSGSRDQEDQSLKPGWENSSEDPILKIPNTNQKGFGGVTQIVEHVLSKRKALSSKPSTVKKKKDTNLEQ
jgi:hypothetical protein